MELKLNKIDAFTNAVTKSVETIAPATVEVVVSVVDDVITSTPIVKGLQANRADYVSLGCIGAGVGALALAGTNIAKGEDYKTPKNLMLSAAGLSATAFGIYKLIKN